MKEKNEKRSNEKEEEGDKERDGEDTENEPKGAKRK